MTTLKVAAHELNPLLTVKIWGLISFAAITQKICSEVLKDAKTATTTTILSSKINTIFCFGKQKDCEEFAWSHVPFPCMIKHVLRVS